MEPKPFHEAVFDVPELCCSEEMTLVEKSLARLSGVEATEPDYLNRTLHVKFRPDRVDPAALARAIEDAGFTVRVHEPTRAEPLKASWRWRGTTAAGGMLLLLAVLGWLALGETTGPVGVLLVTSTVISAVPVFRAAVRALRLWTLDMNVLMSLAALGAMSIGEYFEAATAMFLFAISLWLESHSMDRARGAVRSLLEFSPATAHRIDGGQITDVDPAVLGVGDCVLVRPGERVPVDGVVVEGCSAVNQAPITGESIPVEKTAAEQVFAGSLNGEGSLRVEARRTAQASTLAHIARLVTEAHARRGPTERFIDRFARRYTPVVIALAVVLALGPPLLGRLGTGWAAATTPDEWFRRGLVLLVIACPCALVISTPVTIVCGLFQASRRGILIKGGEHLENAGRIDAVALDKTGTLTTGTARVVDVVPFSTHGATGCLSASASGQPGATAGFRRAQSSRLPSSASETEGAETEGDSPIFAAQKSGQSPAADRILQAAAALELHSEHPLAAAIVNEARRRELPIEEAEDFRPLRGFGVEGTAGGRRLLVGSPRLFSQPDVDVEPHVRAQAAQAATMCPSALVLVATSDRLWGAICLADPLRVGATEAVARLRRIGVRRIAMLTGDARAVAESIARQLDISETHAELLPEDKVRQVEALAAESRRLAMVGDGVNDAPALAAAPLGIALGRHSSDTALETADVVVMTPKLDRLAELVLLGRRCRRILWENISFALAIKGAVLLLAASGMATMWMAVFADVGAGLLVTFNGLRLIDSRSSCGCEHCSA